MTDTMTRTASATSRRPSRAIDAIMGIKLGMTQVFDATNRVVPVTVIAAGPCVVTAIRTADKDGYDAVQLAFGSIDPLRVSKPLTGHFAKAGVTPRRHLAEIRTSKAGQFEIGQEITTEQLAETPLVDVTATSKGKGTSGVMKRHGFKGVSASHGSHRNHRKPGSIGACATPSRVFKGTRMAGRFGGETVTTQNLVMHEIDADNGLLLIKGAVPGPRGGLVVVRTAVKFAQEG